MKRPKIKACRSAWKAYKAAFFELNRRMTLSPLKVSGADWAALEAYRDIMTYSRNPFRKANQDITKTDWELYRESYEYALYLFNRLNAIERRSELEYFCKYRLPRRQNDFLFGFIEILEYACDMRLGSCDYRKVRNFIRRLKAAANHKNRTKA